MVSNEELDKLNLAGIDQIVGRVQQALLPYQGRDGVWIGLYNLLYLGAWLHFQGRCFWYGNQIYISPGRSWIYPPQVI